MNSKILLLGAAIVIAAAGALAYQKSQVGDVDHSMMTSADATPSTKAFQAAMSGMMTGMMVPPTGKPDLDFVQGMIPHHQGAIDMAKVVLQYGKDPEVKSLAENVIKAQDGEITFMKAWLTKTDVAALPVSTEATKGNATAMDSMMKSMMTPYTGDADVDFIKGMIPHHQGAIDMAKVAVQYAKDPDVLKLAGDVVKAQEGEISFMNDWLKRMGK